MNDKTTNDRLAKIAKLKQENREIKKQQIELGEKADENSKEISSLTRKAAIDEINNEMNNSIKDKHSTKKMFSKY